MLKTGRKDVAVLRLYQQNAETVLHGWQPN